MKIASQLLSTAPNLAVKTGSTSDSGMDFHSTLTVAVAAKGTGSNNATQVKAKPLAQDLKSPAPDSKKKDVAPDASVSDVNVPAVTIAKQLPMDAQTQFAVPLPQNNNDASVQTSEQPANGAQVVSEPTGKTSLFGPSLAPISSFASLPTNIVSIGETDPKAVDGKPKLTASSSSASGDGAPVKVAEQTANATQVVSGPMGNKVLFPSSLASLFPVASASSSSASGDGAPVKVAEQTADGTQIASGPIGNKVLFPSSLASLFPVASLPTNTASIGGKDRNTVDGTLDFTASSSLASVLPVGNGVQEKVSTSNNSRPDLTVTSGVAVPNQLHGETPNQFEIPLTQNDEAPAVTSERITGGPQLAANSVHGIGSFLSSVASVTPIATAPSSVPSIDGIGQKIFDTKMDSAASPSLASVFLNGNGAQEKVSGSSNLHSDHIAVPVTLAAKKQPVDSLDRFAITSAQNDEGSALVSDQTARNPQLATISVDGTGSLPSSRAFVSPIAAAPSSVISADGAGSKVFDLKLNAASGSSEGPVLAAGNAARSKLSDSNNSRPDLTVNQAASGPVTAPPAPVTTSVPVARFSESATSKAAPAGQGTDTSKPTNASSSVAQVADTTALASQQATAAVVQSVAASGSLPGFGSISTLPPISAIAVGNSSNGSTSADSLKGVAPRQTTSSAKAKQDSTIPDSRIKSAAGSDIETQAVGTSTGSASVVAKVPDTVGVVTQVASEARNAVEGATLQQIPQVSQPAGPSHTPQGSQSVSVAAEPAAQSLPAQALQDSQATQGVSSAQLVQSMRSSEMKLGMQSAEFGNISISTSLNHQALSAQISFDHLELGKALAVHLPAIEEKLGSAYGVQAKVELRDSNHPASSNESGYSNSGQQSRQQRQSQGGGTTASQGGTFERIAARASFTAVSPTASASRLDIRI